MSDIYAQIKCVEREIAMRKRVYPRLIQAERMEAQSAEEEIKAMEAVLSTLREIAEPSLFPESQS